MTGPSSLETGSGDVTRMGAREAFGFLAVVVVLSGCARIETSYDTARTRDGSGASHAFTRRPAEAPILFPLYFALDSDRLTAAGQTATDAAVTAARKIGATDFAVTGHAGPDTHNIKLSLRRAKVVSEALVARGIDPARISIANQVEVEPTVATAGDLGELASRRVDIILLKED